MKLRKAALTLLLLCLSASAALGQCPQPDTPACLHSTCNGRPIRILRMLDTPGGILGSLTSPTCRDCFLCRPSHFEYVASFSTAELLAQPAEFFEGFDVLYFPSVEAGELEALGITDAQLAAAPWQDVVRRAKRAIISGSDLDRDGEHITHQVRRPFAQNSVRWLAEDECCLGGGNRWPAVLAYADQRAEEGTLRYSYLPWDSLRTSAPPPVPVCDSPYLGYNRIRFILGGPWGAGSHPIFTGTNDFDVCPANGCTWDWLNRTIHVTWQSLMPGGFETERFVSTQQADPPPPGAGNGPCSFEEAASCGGVPWAGLDSTLVLDLDPCSCDPDVAEPEFACCPEDLVVDCDEIPAPATPVAFDRCSPVQLDFDETEEPNPAGCLPILVRTWTATDDAGNRATCTQRLTVVDDEGPVFTFVPPLEPMQTVPCGGPDPDPEVVSVHDNCDPQPIARYTEQVLGSCCEFRRVVLRTWQAADRCGNGTTVTAIRQYVQESPPTVSLESSFACLWQPTGDYVCFQPSDFGAVPAGGCGPLDVRFVSCSSDQPDDAGDSLPPPSGCFNGDKETDNDCTITAGPNGWAACVRAERAGNEPLSPGADPKGRLYTLELVAIDACGVESEPVPVTIWVPHHFEQIAERLPDGPRCLDPTEVGCSGTDGIPCVNGDRMFPATDVADCP
jgi:hypothetical protein